MGFKVIQSYAEVPVGKLRDYLQENAAETLIDLEDPGYKSDIVMLYLSAGNISKSSVFRTIFDYDYAAGT